MVACFPVKNPVSIVVGRGLGVEQQVRTAQEKNRHPRVNAAQVMDLLAGEYGPFVWEPRYDAASELVFTILSQHTSDINSERAFRSLMATFGGVEGMADADVEDIEVAIRSAGLSRVKAPRIKAVLFLVRERVGSFDLTAERVATYRAAKEGAGLAYSPADIAVTRALRIASSAEDRERLLDRQVATLTTLAESSSPPTESGPGNPFYSAPETRREAAEASAILGTPDECVERLRRLEESGVEQILFAGASIEELRLFAEAVMPAFR